MNEHEKNNGGAAERPAILSNQRGSFQTFSESGHLNLLFSGIEQNAAIQIDILMLS